MIDLTANQLATLKAVADKGAFYTFTFSEHAVHGAALRELGLIEGRGDETRLTALGWDAVR